MLPRLYQLLLTYSLGFMENIYTQWMVDAACVDINIYHTISLALLPRVCGYLIRLIRRRNIKNYPDNQVIVMRCSVPMFADLMVRTE